MKLFGRTTCWLLLLAPALSLSAQKDLQKGKIITNNRDTVAGYVGTKPASGLYRECWFSTDKTTPAVAYSPSAISGYVIEGKTPRRFVAVNAPSGSDKMFLEVLAEGEISLYYRKEGAVKYFVQRKGENLLHMLPYERMQRYVDNGYTRLLKTIETADHIDTLKMVMKDKPALFADIDKIQAPDKNNLTTLIDQYNSLDKSLSAIESRSTEPTYSHSELLIKGRMNLFLMTDSDNIPHFCLQKGAHGSLVEIPYHKKENHATKGVIIHDYSSYTTSHIDTLKKYMADATPLYESIDNILIPTKGNLTKLITEYNSYTDQESYQKKHKLKRLPLNIDVVPAFYFMVVNPQDPTGQIGALLDIGFTNTNKHLFLKTGLFVYKGNTPLTDKYHVSSETQQKWYPPAKTYKIPLQIEYRFAETQIQPIISAGYNLYLFNEIKPYNVALMPTITPAINIQAGKRFSARLGFEFEFKNDHLTSYLPKALKRGGFVAGVQIKL